MGADSAAWCFSEKHGARRICALIARSPRDQARHINSIKRLASAGAGAFLVIVEIDEHVASLPLPGPDATSPIGKRGLAIMVLVAALGSVPADVDEIGSALPGRRRVMMIGNAERYVLLSQQPEYRRLIPARMPEFEAVAALLREQFEEGGEAIGIGLEVRR